MIITSRQSGGVTILDLNGTLTVENRNKLPNAVSDHLNNGVRNILLNLTEVSKYDANGLNELLSCIKRTKAMGGKLKLCDPTNGLFGPHNPFNFQMITEVFADESEALASVW